MTYVSNNKIHAILVSAKRGVQRPRPDLPVWAEGEGVSADVEVQRLKVAVLLLRQCQEARALVFSSSGCLLVRFIGICTIVEYISSVPQKRYDLGLQEQTTHQTQAES